MRSIYYIVFVFALSWNAGAQTEVSKTSIVKIFDDAFDVLISDDESMLAVLNGSSYLEIFKIDSLIRLRSVKVSRNAWLTSAYFNAANTKLYFDYGVQVNVRYKVLDIGTGKVEKVDCVETVKGCSYKSLKCVTRDNPIVELKMKPYIFKKEGINVIMYKIE